MDAFANDLHDWLQFNTQALFPNETLLVFFVLAGLGLCFVAFLMAMVALIRNGGRGLSVSILTLLGIAVATAILFVAVLAGDVRTRTMTSEQIAGILLLSFLGAVAILFVVVLVGTFVCFSKTRGAFWLGLVGVLFIASPLIYSHAIEPIIFHFYRPPWVARVDGKLHVTLTGIPNFDYDRLAEYENADVLQMANPDVTDETLKKVANLKLLTELDLNDTQITDAGLAILKSCASLKKLRLANTKITDAGFRDFVLPRDWIEEVDVTGTPVERKTLREWKTMGAALGLDRKFLK